MQGARIRSLIRELRFHVLCSVNKIMCVCVCMHVCICICAYICICIYIYMCVYMYICVCVCIYVYIYWSHSRGLYLPDLIIFQTPNAITLEVRISIYRFWGDTLIPEHGEKGGNRTFKCWNFWSHIIRIELHMRLEIYTELTFLNASKIYITKWTTLKFAIQEHLVHS